MKPLVLLAAAGVLVCGLHARGDAPALAGTAAPNPPDVASWQLDTPDYRIQMNVRFFPPYRGKRLELYNELDPTRAMGYAERFVGALATVTYRFASRHKGAPPPRNFREVVTVLSQAQGIDERPPYVREQPLKDGVGTD